MIVHSDDTIYDLCIIGGGVNGAGIARDAALRGLKVCLLEADDLASGTSSASTKLIHGGLRYLEYYDFKLVRESLQERERLLRIAPHIIWPLSFVLPHDKAQRPSWMIRLGLFLYDRLAKRKTLHGSKGLIFDDTSPLQDKYKKGFCYADCWVEDSRLVILNALDAHQNGAAIFTRTECQNLSITDDGIWHISAEDKRKKSTMSFHAKNIVNAAGPWVFDVLHTTGLANNSTPNIQKVQGSHIIVQKLYDGDEAYILQQKDKRIIFAIPYETHYTLIGTTERRLAPDDDPRNATISEEEVDYLLHAMNNSFKAKLTKDDIVVTYSGVRPLIEDENAESATSTSRDYKLVSDTINGARILSVYGGKITTYRHLATEVMALLYGSTEPCKTDQHPLPGGDIPKQDFAAFYDAQQKQYPFINPLHLWRLCRAYGTNISSILGKAQKLEDLGIHFGEDVFECEIRYLIDYEWAETLEDILYRRSKLYLHTSEQTQHKLQNHLSVMVK